MRPKTVTLTLSFDRDGICQAQTTAGAGNLTINGALASGGAMSRSTAQLIGIYSAADLSARTFTVYGTGYDSSGRYSTSLSDAITGPNASTVETTSYYLTVSRVAVSGAVGSNVEVGTSGKGVSQIIPLNTHTIFPTGLQTAVSGTLSYDVEGTVQNVYDTSLTLSYKPATDMDDATANQWSAFDAEVSGVRVRTNSGSDAATVSLSVICN